MKKLRIVVALGGNALGKNLKEQYIAVRKTSKALVDLIQQGHDIIITHGNGPQVGMIDSAMATLADETNAENKVPLSVCVAMSQAYIGYDLQNSLREELLKRNIVRPVSTVLTQVKVDRHDKGFKDPKKPIGKFMTIEQANEVSEKYGYVCSEDSGRGYRRLVASPKPEQIIELDVIRSMVEDNNVVICCGGGGIPVVEKYGQLKGVSAVIDKDYASELLAENLNADILIILTAVEKVAINFNKPDQKWLTKISADEANELIAQGQFAKGSMLPKVESAVKFALSNKNRTAIITKLEKACDALNGKSGTIITAD